jgi:hypothetical protein
MGKAYHRTRAYAYCCCSSISDSCAHSTLSRPHARILNAALSAVEEPRSESRDRRRSTHAPVQSGIFQLSINRFAMA